jgi:hypothetical protein
VVAGGCLDAAGESVEERSGVHLVALGELDPVEHEARLSSGGEADDDWLGFVHRDARGEDRAALLARVDEQIEGNATCGGVGLRHRAPADLDRSPRIIGLHVGERLVCPLGAIFRAEPAAGVAQRSEEREIGDDSALAVGGYTRLRSGVGGDASRDDPRLLAHVRAEARSRADLVQHFLRVSECAARLEAQNRGDCRKGIGAARVCRQRACLLGIDHPVGRHLGPARAVRTSRLSCRRRPPHDGRGEEGDEDRSAAAFRHGGSTRLLRHAWEHDGRTNSR